MRYVSAVLAVVSMFTLAAGAPAGDRTGVIIGGVVNIREKPSVKAAVVATVKEKESLTVLEWTTVKEKVGKNTSRWVKVRTAGGKTGFMFGSFIFETAELYRGKWITNTETGDTVINWSFTHGGKFRVDFMYPYESPGPGIKSGKAEGTFVIKGDMLLCTYKSASAERGVKPGTVEKLYFFKRDEESLLSYKKFSVDKGVSLDSEDAYELLNHAVK